jgi:hypothetical protein
MKILPSAIQALLCFSVLGSSGVWGNGDVNAEASKEESLRINDTESKLDTFCAVFFVCTGDYSFQ